MADDASEGREGEERAAGRDREALAIFVSLKRRRGRS
jgi:hypothetical protein